MPRGADRTAGTRATACCRTEAGTGREGEGGFARCLLPCRNGSERQECVMRAASVTPWPQPASLAHRPHLQVGIVERYNDPGGHSRASVGALPAAATSPTPPSCSVACITRQHCFHLLGCGHLHACRSARWLPLHAGCGSCLRSLAVRLPGLTLGARPPAPLAASALLPYRLAGGAAHPRATHDEPAGQRALHRCEGGGGGVGRAVRAAQLRPAATCSHALGFPRLAAGLLRPPGLPSPALPRLSGNPPCTRPARAQHPLSACIGRRRWVRHARQDDPPSRPPPLPLLPSPPPPSLGLAPRRSVLAPATARDRCTTPPRSTWACTARAASLACWTTCCHPTPRPSCRPVAGCAACCCCRRRPPRRWPSAASAPPWQVGRLAACCR